MNTVQLECFLAVAENLNFARASEVLHITQPAVTHQINSLEKELEVKLFKRTTRTVELTHAGWNFIEDAKNILGITRMAKIKLTTNTKDKMIPFLIGCHSMLEFSFLPELLKEFIKEEEGIHPIIKTAIPQILRNMMDTESLDIMYGIKTDDFATYTELIQLPIVCICPKNHPFSNKKIIKADDLSYGKIILCDPRRNYPITAHVNQKVIGQRLPHDVYICENIESTFALVKGLNAFTILPDIPIARDSSLNYIPIENSETISYGMYYKNTENNIPLKKLIKISKDFFKTQQTKNRHI